MKNNKLFQEAKDWWRKAFKGDINTTTFKNEYFIVGWEYPFKKTAISVALHDYSKGRNASVPLILLTPNA